MKKIIIFTVSLFFVLLVGIVLYAATIRGVNYNPQISSIKENLDQPTKPFELSPERGRYLLTYSLAEDKSFSLSKKLADAAFPDVGYRNGKFYVYFAPGISVLALPFYFVGKNFGFAQVTTYAMSAFFATVNLALLFLISKKVLKLPTWIAILTALIFGFASTSWSYAITLYQHHVTTFFILSGFYAGWKYKQENTYSWIYSTYIWFSYGAALFLDYPNAILLAPVMIYHLISSFKVQAQVKKLEVHFKTSYLLTSVAFVLLIGLHGYYNTVNFGGPLSLSGGLIGYKTILEKNIQAKSDSKNIIKELQSEKEVKNFFKEDRFPNGISILLASRDRGLLLYAPIFLLGFIGLMLALQTKTIENYFLVGLVAVNFFLYSSWGDPWGGWAYGPRYLIPSMAVLSLFIGLFLSRMKKVAWRLSTDIITFILFAYSSAVALLGALTTNAVPPKIEADFLKMNYNFMHNLIFFKNGQSGSFMFNTYFSKYVTLPQYFGLIWGSLLLVVFVLLFVAPWFEEKS